MVDIPVGLLHVSLCAYMFLLVLLVRKTDLK